MRTGTDEMRAPKYAHVERERRWLLDAGRCPKLDALPCVVIADRYIEGSRLRLRRMTDRLSGATALKLTKKYESQDPLARPIVTSYLDEAEYALLARLPALPLVKRRYCVADGDRVFSIDRFEGTLADLALCEIEWPDDAGLRALVPPSWAGRDVTSDPRYQGSALARHGKPKEPQWPNSSSSRRASTPI